MNTLIFAPHLDDESISCGGLIQKRIKQGWRVHVLFLFGRTYDYGKSDESAKESEDMQRAVSLLGEDKVQVLGTAARMEGEPGKVGYYNLLSFVEPWLKQVKPTEVIGPSSFDLNQDHRHLAHVLDIALRPINLGPVVRRLEFLALDGTSQEPNYYIPLTHEMLQLKTKAVAEYAREARKGTSPRSPENIESQARVWGSQCGHTYAEAYRVKHTKEDLQ